MNKRLHRGWLKITEVFTFTVRIGTTLTYAQVLCVITNLEHLDSWTKHLVVSKQNNQQMRRDISRFY
jgi:hypothetical protein